ALHMRTFVYEPGKNFSGWLRRVWRHAWLDSLNHRTPGGWGSGDSDAHEQLCNVPGPVVCLEEEFQREVLHEALARVRPLVKPRDWEIFNDLVFLGKTGTEVAKQRGLTLAAVGMVKLRVQRAVSQEVSRFNCPPHPESDGAE